jgi:hypothetical protein
MVPDQETTPSLESPPTKSKKQDDEKVTTSITTTTTTTTPKQHHVGVADYFAVLGVGQDLIWKHAQQTQEDDNLEDDAMLLERFYREIVDCTVFVVEEEENPHSNNPNATPTTTRVYSKNHQYAVTLGSPSPSDVTSAVGTQVETEAMEGWTIVQQTRPIGGSPVFFADATSTNTNTSTTSHMPSPKPNSGLWQKTQTWDANLDPLSGLSGEIHTHFSQPKKEKSSTPLKDLRRKVKSTFQQRMHLFSRVRTKYYLSYRRRAPDESHRPAIADMTMAYVRLHRATIPPSPSSHNKDSSSTAGSAVSHQTHQTASNALLRAAEAGKQAVQNRVLRTTNSWHSNPTTSATTTTTTTTTTIDTMDFSDLPAVALKTLMDLPSGYDEWSIPDQFQELRFPSMDPGTPSHKTLLFSGDDDAATTESSEVGVEAVERPPSEETWQQQIRPKLVVSLNNNNNNQDVMAADDEDYVYIPILAIRRQRVGNEERYHEDPAMAEIAVMFRDAEGIPVLPAEELDDEFDEPDAMAVSLLDKTAWEPTGMGILNNNSKRQSLGTTCLVVRRNRPLGFCDAAFSTSVMDRFPYKNYKGLPLPEEELPMFCYPTGCRLQRAKFCEAPLPQYYGFVVKNERGDSIYVSCVSFMEPLTVLKQEQLARLSERRRRVSLPHARFWAKRQRRLQPEDPMSSMDASLELDDQEEEDIDHIYTGFEDIVTFENKTICLVSRYPYWTAFRRFLSHLHSISESSSDVPLERYISHLLLTVPVPKPGGPKILIPLPSFTSPLVLSAPPMKDLPLVDLPYERLVSCLDVPTIVTIVLGFLALERKVRVSRARTLI